MGWRPCRVHVIGWLALIAAGCASGPAIRITAPGVEERIIRPGKLQPVELSVEELRAGMAMLTANLPAGRNRPSVSVAACSASTGPEDLRVVRVLGPGGPTAILDTERRMDLAWEAALSAAVREAAGTLGSITPTQVRAMLSMAIIGTIVCVVSPDPISKLALLVMSANLVAFLGVDVFNNVVKGYLTMEEEALAARDEEKVRAAGELYGARLGPSVARIMVMVASFGIAKLAGVGPSSMAKLPGGGRAAALAEAQGFQLGAVSSVESVALAADGTLTIALGNAVAMAGTGQQGGGSAGEYYEGELPSSEKLAKNMLGPNGKRPEGTAAHHIVAGEAEKASLARRVPLEVQDQDQRSGKWRVPAV